MDFPYVFQPLKIGSKIAKNRIEIGPAAPFLAGHDGSLTPELYEYERQLAASGAAIVNIGVTDVDPDIHFSSRILNAGTDENQPDFNDLAELFHSYDTLAGVELIYLKYMLSDPNQLVNEMTTAEVEAMIEAFAAAAKRVAIAGFDVVFVHGGHGNVPAMFFSQKYNKRTDRFGGSFEGRCQFAVELLTAIRTAIGSKVAIEYRISAEEMLPGYTTFEETLEFAKVIEPYIDMLHVSRGILEVDDLLHYVHPPFYLERALNLPFAKKFKEELHIPVTCVGSFNLELAEKAIEAGDVDMISMVRAFLADNRMMEKARHGDADNIRPCLRCNTCIDRTHSYHQGIRCAVNPLLTRETRFDIDRNTALPLPTLTPYRVAVVGGGPAGMQAAMTLKQRGHEPVLFERSDHLGGLLAVASQNKGKEEIKAYMQWLIKQMECENIEVRLGVEATPELLLAEDKPFDAVFLAQGSEPVKPNFAESQALPVKWVGDFDLYERLNDLGENVLVAGAGLTGLECALSLAHEGKNVTIADGSFSSEPVRGGTVINLRCIYELLEQAGAVIIRKARVIDATPAGAILQSPDGTTVVHPCDSVVYSLGFKVNTDKLKAFENTFTECHRIGDCRQGPCTIFNATQSAFDAAMHL